MFTPRAERVLIKSEFLVSTATDPVNRTVAARVRRASISTEYGTNVQKMNPVPFDTPRECPVFMMNVIDVLL